MAGDSLRLGHAPRAMDGPSPSPGSNSNTRHNTAITTIRNTRKFAPALATYSHPYRNAIGSYQKALSYLSN